MANVLLRFQLALLEQAEAKAKAALLSIQTAVGLGKDLKRGLTQAARDKLLEARALKEDFLAKLRVRKRDGRGDIETDDEAFGSEMARALRKGRKGLLDFVGNPLRDFASGSPTEAILGLAGEIGGPLVKVIAAAVTQQVVALVDAKIAEEVELRVSELGARLDEQIYQADYQRRLKDEPDFRREQARESADEMNRDEERLRVNGWGRSADFLDGI